MPFRWASLWTKSVLLNRSAGIGDVLCTEPIARKLYNKGFYVYIQTYCGEVYVYHHDIIKMIKKQSCFFRWKRKLIRINLNGAYERRPLIPIVDAYAEEVRNSIPDFTLTSEEKCPIYDKNIRYTGNKSHIQKICINNEGTWESRTYPHMKDLAMYLKQSGYDIAEIGRDPAHYLGIGTNYYGRLALHDTVRLMSECDLYIGMDGGLMHFAQSIHMPCFIIFGCTCPNFRIHDWSITKVMWKNTDVLSCAGCHHRRSAPREFTECDRDTLYCLDWPPEMVLRVLQEQPFGNKPVLHKEIYQVYPEKN
jgi:ADP-heptose:LPS heptosyltransferase